MQCNCNAMDHSSCSQFLLTLPTEVLEYVVLQPELSLQDVCSFSQTCSTLYRVVSRLWEKLATSRWTYWGSLDTAPNCNWRQLCRQRYLCEIHVHKTISSYLLRRGMCILHMSDDELNTFSHCLDKWDCSSDMLHCVFEDILSKNVRDAQLGDQYYSLYGMEYTKRKGLIEQWKDLLKQPVEEHHLEDGAILISQWMQPFEEISQKEIHQELDRISETVAMEILSQHSYVGESPSSSGDSEVKEIVKRLNLSTTSVLDTLNSVFFGKLGFKKSPLNDYYNFENNFIDKVLKNKTGIPITLSVIYQAVAKHLGVHLLCVNSPFHFLLRLADPSLTEKDPVFIDVFEDGLRRTALECHLSLFNTSMIQGSTIDLSGNTAPIEVYLRMVANMYENCQRSGINPLGRIHDRTTGKWGCILLTSALSLQLCLGSVVRPGENIIPVTHRVLRAAELCIKLSYNSCLVIQVITQLLPTIIEAEKAHSHCPSFWNVRLDHQLQHALSYANEVTEEMEEIHRAPLEIKTRSDGLRYRVGMIMKHLRYDYHCVIRGWDHKCEMGLPWIIQMGVSALRRGQHQPFYNVLVEDGTNRYAAEDSLAPCPPGELCHITHCEVGRFFSSFTGDHYTPNEFLKQQYPED